MPPRPSHKELTKKLNAALDCLNEPDRPRVLIDKSTVIPQIATNVARLGLQDDTEYWELVVRCLTKALEDPENTYTGRKPPEYCNNVKILKKCEMFAFSVYDKKIGKTVYTKFAIKKMKDDTQWYGHITCHEDEPK